jgi:hypothetical protein
MTKKFLIEVEYDERTRWLKSDNWIKNELEVEADLVMIRRTLGPRPAVSVVPVNNATVVDSDALAVLQRNAGLKR